MAALKRAVVLPYPELAFDIEADEDDDLHTLLPHHRGVGADRGSADSSAESSVTDCQLAVSAGAAATARPAEQAAEARRRLNHATRLGGLFLITVAAASFAPGVVLYRRTGHWCDLVMGSRLVVVRAGRRRFGRGGRVKSKISISRRAVECRSLGTAVHEASLCTDRQSKEALPATVVQCCWR